MPMSETHGQEESADAKAQRDVNQPEPDDSA
jgi:hypothetical protein